MTRPSNQAPRMNRPSVTTERDWFATGDPLAMLARIYPMRSPDSRDPQDRRSRLYLLACARRAWDRLPWVCRTLVEVGEMNADGQPVDARLQSAARAAADKLTDSASPAEVLAEAEEYLALGGRERSAGEVSPVPDPQTWKGLAYLVYFPFYPDLPPFGHVPAELHSVELVREVFGNPFRPVRFEPRWQTTTVRDLARGMYRARDFSGMPVLADALEDAGCVDPAVLAHCRREANHVRGCWVLDGLLGAADRR